MIRTSVLSALAVLGMAPALGAQKIFEGTIIYQVKPAGGTAVELVLRSNGRKLREDMRAPGSPDEANSYQILDGESGDITLVIPAARQYIAHNLEKLRASAGARADSSPSRATEILADVVATGRRETIAGLACDVYIRKTQPGDEWCLTSVLGRFGALDGELVGANAMSGAMRPFKDGALALRMTVGSASGRPTTMIATKVERMPPPASVFKVPDGFTELKNPMMPRP